MIRHGEYQIDFEEQASALGNIEEATIPGILHLLPTPGGRPLGLVKNSEVSYLTFCSPMASRIRP